MSKNTHLPRAALPTILSTLLLLFAGCGGGKGSQPGTDAAPDTATGNDANDVDTGTGTDDGGTADTGTAPVAITVSESAYTFATPDLNHGLTAAVTGTTTTTVTWASSNTYIATVSPAGQVTSVSGGTAAITATSNADPTRSASCTIMVAEPNRARAASYVDAKSITSGLARSAGAIG